MQLELFSTATTTAAGEPHCNIPGRSSGDCKTGFDFGSVSDSRTEAGIDAEVNVNASGGEAPLSAGSAASSGSGGSGSKPAGRAPVQPGRTAWCEDGETLFILSHEGKVVGGSCDALMVEVWDELCRARHCCERCGGRTGCWDHLV